MQGLNGYWVILLMGLNSLQGASAHCSLSLSVKDRIENIVPIGYQRVATEIGVPCDLLYAMALTESGQSRFSQNQWRPWPWTLNIEGRGQYFSSRREAWVQLEKVVANESGSVDVGLLQIAWRYHQQALGSTWQALDPYHNLRVGAAILKRCFDSPLDWWQSVGCYHAPNDKGRAARYQQRVQHLWRKISPSAIEASTP